MSSVRELVWRGGRRRITLSPATGVPRIRRAGAVVRRIGSVLKVLNQAPQRELISRRQMKGRILYSKVK
jgi:hypothetical protein